MRKLIAFIKVGWQLTIAYRAENAIWFILDSLPLVYLLSLWNSLEVSGKITHTQAAYLTFYYLATLIISRVTASEFDTWAVDDVKDGRVSIQLLKPYSYKTYLFINELVYRSSNIMYVFPTLLLVLPFTRGVEGIVVNPMAVITILFLLCSSFFQRFCLSLIVVTSAFWLEQAKFLSHFKWMLEGVLGGLWLPISFFPLWLQTISKSSPFYTWYYLPIQILTGRASQQDILSGIISCVAWAVGLHLFASLFWKKAIAKYSAVGS